MVAKNPKSKRLNSRLRSKIARKARETHRKQRKAAKASGHLHRRTRKDPGIPALFPMREEMVQKLRAERELERQQKAARKAVLRTGATAPSEDDDMSGDEEEALDEEAMLAAMARKASAKDEAFDAQECADEDEAPGLSVVRDNSRRAFQKDLKAVVEGADVILAVLDARDPLGCRVREVEEAILTGGSGKRLVIVLNKADLVPKENVLAWQKYLQRDFPTLIFKASTQEARQNLGQRSLGSGPQTSFAGSEAVGAEELLQLLKNYARSHSKKMRVRVGVVGYPNVGKSSLINSLKRARVCQVGATPGVTTSRQEIHLDKTVTLIDCPGIVFAASSAGSQCDLFLRNCLRVEQLDDPISPALLAINKATPEAIIRLYALPLSAVSDASNPERSVLSALAQRLGKVKKGGVLDLEATARHLLGDWNGGKIAYCAPVPTDRDHLIGGAEIIHTFAPAMDLFNNSASEVNESENDSKSESVDEDISDSDNQMEIDESTSPSLATSRAKKLPASGPLRQKKTVPEYTEEALSPELAAFNPQSNQMRARELKKSAKKVSKLERRQLRTDMTD